MHNVSQQRRIYSISTHLVESPRIQIRHRDSRYSTLPPSDDQRADFTEQTVSTAGRQQRLVHVDVVHMFGIIFTICPEKMFDYIGIKTF